MIDLDRGPDLDARSEAWRSAVRRMSIDPSNPDARAAGRPFRPSSKPGEASRDRDPTVAAPAFYARLAGFGYLVIIACGIFAEFFVRQNLIVPGEAAATAGNIVAAEGLYRLSLVSEFVMLLADVLLAMALYVVFRPVDRNLALLAAFFRLVHASVVGLNLLNTYMPLLLLSGVPYLGVFDAAELHALVLLFLEAHAYGYVIGLVFFGLHCLVLGRLVFRSGYVPALLGVLLAVAGVAYLIDGLGRSLFSDYQLYASTLELVVLVPAFVAELSFALWLSLKGVDPARLGADGSEPAAAS